MSRSAALRASLAFALAGGIGGCAYFNTYYNAEAAYRDGLRLQATSPGQAAERFRTAQEKAAAVVKRWPASRWADDAFLLIGRASYQLGDYDRALSYFDNYLKAFPAAPVRFEVNYLRALALGATGKGVAARTMLEELAAQRPWRERALRAIADSYFTEEDYAAAITAYERLRAEFPRSGQRVGVELALGDAYVHEGDYTRAALAFEANLKRARTSRTAAETRLKLADAYYRGGQYRSARSLLDKVFGFYPELEGRAYLLLGKILLAEARTTEGVTALGKVTGNEYRAEAYFLIGRAAEEAKDFARASAYYDSARSASGASDFGLQALKRRSFLDRLTTTDSTATADPARSQFLLAELYYLSLNQPDEALVEYGKVATDYPQSPYAPKALLAQAWLLDQVLKQDGAAALYQQITERYPNTEYARRAQQALEKRGPATSPNPNP